MLLIDRRLLGDALGAVRLVVCHGNLPSALRALDAVWRDGGVCGVGLLVMLDEVAGKAADKVAEGTPM